MRRFDYERRMKVKKNSYKSEQRYYIYDRRNGTDKLATVYDVADAEMICAALNNDTVGDYISPPGKNERRYLLVTEDR